MFSINIVYIYKDVISVGAERRLEITIFIVIYYIYRKVKIWAAKLLKSFSHIYNI